MWGGGGGGVVSTEGGAFHLEDTSFCGGGVCFVCALPLLIQLTVVAEVG